MAKAAKSKFVKPAGKAKASSTGKAAAKITAKKTTVKAAAKVATKSATKRAMPSKTKAVARPAASPEPAGTSMVQQEGFFASFLRIFSASPPGKKQ